MAKKLKLNILPNKFSICRLRPNYDYPRWAENDIFYSITKTEDELSVVTLENSITVCPDREDGWRVIKIVGPLKLSMIGVVSKISEVLAKAKVSIFVISTFDTEYIMVKNDKLEKAKKVLETKYDFVEQE